ncbi:MAG TPA: flippase-like domain-containing protein [Nanoarchaeota archaeon]|nr:flippase-like domain-containing protein [Nanoarchaeota archaeon]
MKKSFLLSMIFGIVLMMFIFAFFWKDIIPVLNKAELEFVIVAIFFYVLFILIWAERWRIFIEGQKPGIKEIFPVLIAGIAINNLTPLARIGGEPVRAYMLKIIAKIKFTKGMASTLSELVAEFLSQLLIVLISLPILFSLQTAPWLLTCFMFFALIYLLGGLMIINIQDELKIKKLFTWLSFKFRRFSIMRAKISKVFFSFQSALKTNLANKENLKKSLILSLIMKGFEILKIYAIFLALNYEISLLMCFVILSVTIIISVIPATPGSMGIMEGGLISFLIISGIPHGIAAAFVIIDRIITFWIPTIAGIILMHKYGITEKMLSLVISKR